MNAEIKYYLLLNPKIKILSKILCPDGPASRGILDSCQAGYSWPWLDTALTESDLYKCPRTIIKSTTFSNGRVELEEISFKY